MSSSFLGLSIAASGLFANQRALGVTSHNIANANTEGYSRQRLDMHAYRPDELPGGMGTLGTGVDVDPVKQIRNRFLDFKYRGEFSEFSEWEAKYEVLQNVEGILNEPSDSGMRQLMDDFYSSLQELSKNPESLSVRTLVRERALALVKGISGMSSSLKDLQADLNFEFEVGVKDLNGYAQQIADLNKVIFETELEGGAANDARDQRNLLLDKMSEYANIDYFEDAQKRFTVTIGGHAIVSHYRADELVTEKREEKLNPDDVDGLLNIKWKDGSPFRTSSGKLKGILEVRDNIDGEDKGIPYYIDRLNVFMDTVVGEINRIHSGGFDLQGKTGNAFFTINGMSTAEFNTHLKNFGLNNGPAVDVSSIIEQGVSYDSMTDEEVTEKIVTNIGNFISSNPQYSDKNVHYVDGRYLVVDRLRADQITLSSELDDVNFIAASKTQTGIPGDGENILNMAKSRHNVNLYDWGSPDDFVKSLVSNLGVDGQAAKNLMDNQELLVNNVQVAKQSIMGVSLDEEMTNMVKYQHAYSASARMINTIDEMLDLIVNRLGLVGR